MSARNSFIYFNDGGDLVALRYDNWKLVFEQQEAQGTLFIWANPFTKLRVAKLFDLHADPFERADITSNTYYDWLLDHAWTLIPAQAFVAGMLESLVEFPPSQAPASFTINQVMAKLGAGIPSA